MDLKRASGGVLRSVGSRTDRSARALASHYGVQRIFTDLTAMLDDDALDIVYIATPHQLHASDAIQCLTAGRAVLCEKPMAVSAAQTGEIVAHARERNLFCMEAMWTRFIPAVRYALQLAKGGEIGRIMSLRGDFSHPVAYHPASRFYAPELGGGALLDRGVYLISLAQALLGEPVRVQASVRKAPSGVDAHSAYLLEFSNGAIGQFVSSLAVRGDNSFTVEGENGRIILQEPFVCSHRVTVERYAPFVPRAGGAPVGGIKTGIKARLKDLGVHRKLDVLRGLKRQLSARTFAFAGNGYQFELDEAMRCLRDGKTESAAMSLDDSLAVARTMDRLRANWD